LEHFMSHFPSLTSRLVKAAAAFVFLHAALLAMLAAARGDAAAMQSLLLMVSGFSIAAIAGILAIVLPVAIAFGSSGPLADNARKYRWPAAGALSAAAIGCFFVYGPDAGALLALAGIGAAAGLTVALVSRLTGPWAAS
jgi:hypothetical protein